MEVAGFVIGSVTAVGLLGQIFDGCIKAYSFFTAANNLGKDSEKLVCKIRIEEMRLRVWGREWGVVEGQLEKHIAASGGNEELKKLAVTILKQLLDTITDFNKLQDRYGLREDAPSDEKLGNPSAKEPSKSRLRDELRLRARWVISDRDKFDTLLIDLKDYNDGLERLFPPTRTSNLERSWTNELLQTAARDTHQLNLLENASKGVYPHLNTFANLKQLRINLDSSETQKFIPTSSLKIPLTAIDLTPESAAPTEKRVASIYRRNPEDAGKAIIIEFISYDDDLDLDSRLHLYQRVDNLARMVHSASNQHPDLHTLDCLGYLDDTTSKRYGLIYCLPPDCPSKSPNTLIKLIDDPQIRTPDLGERFKLAHTLSVALWSFHSLDWLHKTFCGGNILLFNDSEHSDSLRNPYVTGFDSSRPDSLAEMTVASSNDIGQDLYRHPDSLGVWRQSYRKAFDIYSLGLVLLEIGLWKNLKGFYKPKYTPTIFRDKVVLSVLVPGLASKTGSRYRDVVSRCLRFEGGDGTGEEAGRLMEWVVGTLESLRV